MHNILANDESDDYHKQHNHKLTNKEHIMKLGSNIKIDSMKNIILIILCANIIK